MKAYTIDLNAKERTQFETNFDSNAGGASGGAFRIIKNQSYVVFDDPAFAAFKEKYIPNYEALRSNPYLDKKFIVLLDAMKSGNVPADHLAEIDGTVGAPAQATPAPSPQPVPQTPATDGTTAPATVAPQVPVSPIVTHGEFMKFFANPFASEPPYADISWIQAYYAKMQAAGDNRFQDTAAYDLLEARSLLLIGIGTDDLREASKINPSAAKEIERHFRDETSYAEFTLRFPNDAVAELRVFVDKVTGLAAIMLVQSDGKTEQLQTFKGKLSNPAGQAIPPQLGAALLGPAIEKLAERDPVAAKILAEQI